MAEVKKTFTRGIMDMGTDARLIQDGVYRYGLNIDVAGSESSDQGVVQNIRGNVSRVIDFELVDDNPIVIGSAVDEINSRIYYFWVSQNSEGIYEYDLSTINDKTGGGTTNRILEFNSFDSKKPFLNFQVDNLITGARVIDNLLIWTDGINPVRMIDIDRFRGSGNLVECPRNGSSFTCPTGVHTTSIDGVEYFLQSGPNPNYDANGDRIVDADGGSSEYVNVLPDAAYFSTDLINLGKRPPLFPPQVSTVISSAVEADYEPNIARPEDKLYGEFVRFAIRYRYKDGQTTPFSPFSVPVFIPGNYELNSETGVLESMVNTIKECNVIFDVGESEVKEIDILYKEGDSSAVYVVETISKEARNLGNSNKTNRVTFEYKYDGSKVYRLLPSNELTRTYDNIPITAKSLEIAGNRLVLGNYTENRSLKRNGENGETITPSIAVDFEDDLRDEAVLNSFSTCKTGRDYQVGVVYLDELGRQSPVVVSSGNTIHIPNSSAGRRNRLTVEVSHEAPYWATHWRPFVQQSRGQFYNIIPKVTLFEPNSGNVYINIYDSDINKADVGDILLRKIYNGDIEEDPVQLRVVEAKRLIEASTAANNQGVTKGNELPSRLRSTDSNNDVSYEGYYLICAYVNADDKESAETFASNATANQVQVFETVPDEVVGDLYYESPDTFRCYNGRHSSSRAENLKATDRVQTLQASGAATNNAQGRIKVILSWFNAFGWSNGVETMTIEEQFNGKTLDQGARASTVQEQFEQYDRKSWLIHSGIYVDSTNLNRLNDFNVSENRTKDLDISDGSIQKLHFRDTNLYVFQERKVKNVPINKNVIQTADGGQLTTGGSQYFGTERAYAGNYGISTNPESFASYGSRMYFADKNRGAIMRLSNDGLTEISKSGMEAFVRRYIADAEQIECNYNDYSDELDISFKNIPNLTPSNGNRRIRRIATQGAVDPRTSCQTNYSDLDFEDFYVILQRARAVEGNVGNFNPGDVVYTDNGYDNAFNGQYNWFVVETGGGNSVDYNTSIQISNDGVVTAVIRSCSETYPRFIKHTSFNISSDSFISEVDCCANGQLNEIAYHSGNGPEPIIGDTIYEGRSSLSPSNRVGWYKINAYDGNDSFTYYAIFIRDGVVTRKINCERIDNGRYKRVGTPLIPIVASETEFDRHVRICTTSLSEVWWFDDFAESASVGETIYENNFNSQQPGAGYIAFADGEYVTVNASGVITAVGNCATKKCDYTPNDTFIPDPGHVITTEVGATKVSFTSNTVTLRANSLINQTLSGGQAAYEDGDLVTVTFTRTASGTTSPPIIRNARVQKTATNLDFQLYDPSGAIATDSGTYVFKIQSIINKYTFKFLGFDVDTTINSVDTTVKVGVPSADLYWVEKGTASYPTEGSNRTTFGELEEDNVYRISNTGDISEYESNVVLVKVCYDEIVGGTSTFVFARYGTNGSLGVATQASAITTLCEATTDDTLYYNPDITPKRYYTSNTLDEDFVVDGDNKWFGIAYDTGSNAQGTASVVVLEQIDDNGYVVNSTRVHCSHRNSITLSYVPNFTDFENSGWEACRLYDGGTSNRKEYWANNTNFTGASNVATQLREKDGNLTVPPDGTYSSDSAFKTLAAGTLSTSAKSCPVAFQSRTLRFSPNDALTACTASTQTLYSPDVTYFDSRDKLYTSAYAAAYADSGYYSDGTDTGYWNKQTGRFDSFGSCTVDNNIDADIDPNENTNLTNDVTEIDPDPLPQYNYRYVTSGSAASACTSSTSENIYHVEENNFAANRLTNQAIYTDANEQTLAASSRIAYSDGSVYRTWDGSNLGASTACATPAARKLHRLRHGTTVDSVCGDTISLLNVYYADVTFTSSSLDDAVAYAGVTGSGTISSSTASHIGDGVYYRTWDGSNLGSATKCPEKPDCKTNQQVTLRYGSTGLNACGATDSGNSYYYIGSTGQLTDPIYSNCFATTANRPAAGFYAIGNTYRQWTGSAWTGNEMQCIVNTGHNVSHDSNVDVACGYGGTPTSATRYFNGNFEASGVTHVYSGQYSSTVLTGESGYYSLGGFYRSVDGSDGSLGAYTECQQPAPETCLYSEGVNWSYASDGVQACKNNADGITGNWVSDNGSLIRASTVRNSDFDALTCDTEAAYNNAATGYYSDGGVFRYYDGTRFDSASTSCNRVCLSYTGSSGCPSQHLTYNARGTGNVNGTITYDGATRKNVPFYVSVNINSYGAPLTSGFAVSVVVDGVTKTHTFTAGGSPFASFGFSLDVSNTTEESFGYTINYVLPETLSYTGSDGRPSQSRQVGTTITASIQ